MSVSKPLYSKEEFARRGDEIYDRDISPHIGPADEGKLVVVDIERENTKLIRMNWLPRTGFLPAALDPATERVGHDSRLLAGNLKSLTLEGQSWQSE